MKIPKIIYNDSFLNFFNIEGIALFPFIIISNKTAIEVINHEMIHIKQQQELLVILFYVWFCIEYFLRLFMKGNAYENISFEREAYANEKNLDYLKNRKWYSFFKYI